MRVGIAILFSSVVSVLATIIVVKIVDQSQLQKELESKDQYYQTEKSKMDRQLKSARQKSGRVQVVENRVVNRLLPAQSASEILNRLADLQVQGGGRFSAQRRIIFGLEQLSELGPVALADINEFLSRGTDVDFAKMGIVNDSINWQAWNTPANSNKKDAAVSAEEAAKKAAENQLRYQDAYKLGPSEYLCPPTLRLGVIEALGNIGGEAVEQSLAEVLRTVHSTRELVMLDQMLDQMMPGKYLKDVLSAAKEGLAKPRSVAGTNSEEWREDWSQRSRLYAILIKHDDASFADEAQSQLILANGQVDNEAMNYLQRVLKEKSVLYFVDAIRHTDEAKVGYSFQYLNSAILRFAGESDGADQYFLDTMQGTQKLQSKTAALYALSQSQITPEGALRRLDLLSKAEQFVKDEAFQQHFKSVRRKLEYYRDPKNGKRDGVMTYEWNGQSGVSLNSLGGTLKLEQEAIIIRPGK